MKQTINVKCNTKTFVYSDKSQKTFHQYGGERDYPDLTDAFGQSQAPEGQKLVEVIGGAHYFDQEITHQS